MHKQRQILQLDSKDNVAVALTDLKSGESVSLPGRLIPWFQPSPPSTNLPPKTWPSEPTSIMYGGLVGKTTGPIRRGELLTTGNIHHDTTDFHEKSGTYHWTPPTCSVGVIEPSSAITGPTAR